MCDTSALRNWLLAVIAAATAAVALLVVAAAVNASLFLAWKSPGWVLAAAAAAASGAGLGQLAVNELNGVCACLRPHCRTECYTLRLMIRGIMVDLGIYVVATLVLAAHAWIAWAAQPAIWAIIALWIGLIGFLTYTIGYLVALDNCARGRPPATQSISGESGEF